MMRILSLLVAALMLLPLIAKSENEVPAEIRAKLKSEMLLRNSSQGTKFIVTIPPNEIEDYPCFMGCEIYIASQAPTNIKVSYRSDQKWKSTYRINTPLEVITVPINFQAFEVREEEQVSGEKTIIIESNRPVSVYVINSKYATSDGYMAIPVSAWGNEYIHCSYYDHNEMTLTDFAGGFIVMAIEDNTQVAITARGVGVEGDSTSKGHKIGDKWNVTLNSGEYYMVRGAAQDNGKFDLTGTLIQGDKPIGVISFHERTGLPWAISSSRNCLNEMQLPVTTWSTKYVSVEVDRGDKGKGDIFRVVASEANTKFSIKWYDIKTRHLIDSINSEIINPGGFYEYISYTGHVTGTNLTSIKGVSVFESDKPIMVMQYSPEESWDNAKNAFDPFMVIVPSVDDYSFATIFQVPTNQDFTTNKINLVVRGDTLDWQRNESLLKSLAIDGVPVYTLDSNFLTNRVPDTDLYFLKGLSVSLGSHYMTADTKFGGFLYGRMCVDSYGWPLSMSIDFNHKHDTTEPQAILTRSAYTYKIRITELDDTCNGKSSNVKQSGITEYPVLLSGSYNISEPILSSNFTLWPPNFDSEFYLRVDDITKEGKAIFMVVDLKGNYTIDSVFYDPKLSVNENIIEGYSMQDVMPNPVNDNQFMIRFSTGDNTNTTKIEMLNMNGEVVKLISNELMNAGDHTLNVSTNDLPSGTYLVKITSGAYVASQKVVIVK